MVQNAGCVLKNGLKQEAVRQKTAAKCLLLSHIFR